MILRTATLVVVTLCAGCAPNGPTFDIEYGAGEIETITAENVRITYLEKGEGDPVIFFLPRTDPSYWQFQIEALSNTHRALSFDYEFEQPVQENPVAPEGLIAALETLRDELDVDGLNVVTHSFSGRQALEIAIARPDLFSALVVEEPAGAPSPDSNVLPPVPECALENPDPMELQTCRFLSPMMGYGRFEALPLAMRDHLVESQRASSQGVEAEGGGEFVALLNDLLTRPICSELGELPMPVLFVRGADTPAWLQSMLDAYEECLPQHETARIAGASHMVHLEQPAAFNQAVLAFLGPR